jgi:large subunit ribosomal protein L18
VGKTSEKIIQRTRRRVAIRKRITGTTERPRLSVFRSIRHIYAQVIDDSRGQTLASASTKGKEEQAACAELKPVAQAKRIGEILAARCKAAGVEKVVFDRGGYKYHGRVQAVAEGAREGGLEL